jgi:hypothetical protein
MAFLAVPRVHSFLAMLEWPSDEENCEIAKSRILKCFQTTKRAGGNKDDWKSGYD